MNKKYSLTGTVNSCYDAGLGWGNQRSDEAGFKGYQNTLIDYKGYSSSKNSNVFLKYDYGNKATKNEFDLTQLAAYTNSNGYDTLKVF